MANARVRRGRSSQELLAEYAREHGFPNAQAVGASLPGKDILWTPELAIEMKATSQANLTGALAQAIKNAGADELPVVVYRPNGYGEARLPGWLFVTSVHHGFQLLADAGYGDFSV